jgi:hypothetical protein
MKRITLVFGLILTLVSFKATAGVVPTNEDKATQQTSQMIKMLSLSTDQATAVKTVLLSTLNSIDAITADATKDGSAKELAIKQAKEERDTKLSEILTPDQYATYVAKRDERKAGREGVH